MSKKELWVANCPKCNKEEVTSCNCVMLCNCGEEYAVIVTALKFPFISVKHSTLGGDERVSIMLAVATTTPDKWTNGIFKNSDYVRIEISNTGTVKHFDGANMKLRKKTVKSLQDAITHINDKMQAAIIPDDYNYFTNNKITWRFLKDGS